MGYSRLALYLVGLLVVVVAAWIFLTQTPVGEVIPFGVALALILLIVGIGVMASASSINDARYSRRVVRDNVGGPVAPTYERRVVDTGPAYGTERVIERTGVVPPATGETVIEERRLD